eukprot:2330739-Rhodomonas_salina.2
MPEPHRENPKLDPKMVSAARPTGAAFLGCTLETEGLSYEKTCESGREGCLLYTSPSPRDRG